MLLLQRNELLTDKQKWLKRKFGRFFFTNFFINFYQKPNLEKAVEELFISEMNTFKEYLPKSVRNIMDVGCGLGIININLNKFYDTKPNFFLIDKNRIDLKIKYGFSSNYESYNNLDETRKILLNNNLDKNCFKLLNAEKKIYINQKIDLVISLKSMGYHYPFENYLEIFCKCCYQKTKFIFDVNKDYFYKNDLSKYFKNIKVIYKEESIHPLIRLFCTGFLYSKN